MNNTRLLSTLLACAALAALAPSADAAQAKPCMRGGGKIVAASPSVQVVTTTKKVSKNKLVYPTTTYLACSVRSGLRFPVGQAKGSLDASSSLRLQIVEDRYLGVVVLGDSGIKGQVVSEVKVVDVPGRKLVHDDSACGAPRSTTGRSCPPAAWPWPATRCTSSSRPRRPRPRSRRPATSRPPRRRPHGHHRRRAHLLHPDRRQRHANAQDVRAVLILPATLQAWRTVPRGCAESGGGCAARASGPPSSRVLILGTAPAGAVAADRRQQHRRHPGLPARRVPAAGRRRGTRAAGRPRAAAAPAVAAARGGLRPGRHRAARRAVRRRPDQHGPSRCGRRREGRLQRAARSRLPLSARVGAAAPRPPGPDERLADRARPVRTCVPGRAARAFCVFVQLSDIGAPGISVDPDRSPNPSSPDPTTRGAAGGKAGSPECR